MRHRARRLRIRQSDGQNEALRWGKDFELAGQLDGEGWEGWNEDQKEWRRVWEEEDEGVDGLNDWNP